MAGRVGIRVYVVKIMGRTYAPERADRRSEVEMISRNKEAAAALAERGDRSAILFRKSVAGVHGEKPKLIDVRISESEHDRVTTVAIHFAVASDHFVERQAVIVMQRLKMPLHKREAPDVPVVFNERDRCLEKDL